MKSHTVRQAENRDSPAEADSEINDRLVEILKANAIKADPTVSAATPERKRGILAETYALASLIGLMAVAYVYSLLVNNEA